MNLESISNQLLYTTVRLTALGGRNGGTISTGFMVAAPSQQGDIPFLVTCDHSIKDASHVELSLVRSNSADQPELGKHETIRLSAGDFLSVARKDSNLDVYAIPFGPVLNHFLSVKANVFVRPLPLSIFIEREQRLALNALEDIIFVGYPKGLQDDINMLPLIRRGISSTPIWADFQGNKWFLIDAEVYAGSSGSPVFILNEGSYATKGGLVIGTRFHFVGMIIKSLEDPSTRQHIGLGAVLAADPIRNFLLSAAADLTRN